MKIVYTPIFEDKGSHLSNGVYNNKFLDTACLLLSITLIEKFYDNIEIRTNSDFGSFVKKLFPKVNIVEQKQQPYGDHNWQMNKIISYSQQKEPFIHMDHDIFISHPFDIDWWKNGYLVQHLETTPEKQSIIYSIYSAAKMKGQVFPDYTEERARNKNWTQHNMGIFGCIDIDSCKRFCSDILNCVGRGTSFRGQAIIYEQFSFSAFSDKNNIPVAPYLNEETIAIDAREKGYCHLMGGKENIKTVAQTIDSLGRHNPEALYAMYKNFNSKTGKKLI